MPRKKGDNRIQRLTFRVTDAEMRKIYESAEQLGLSGAGYARHAVMMVQSGAVEKIVKAVEEMAEIRKSVSGMGKNLNQAMLAVWVANKGENKEAVEAAINNLWCLILAQKAEAVVLAKNIAPDMSKKLKLKPKKQEVKQCPQ